MSIQSIDKLRVQCPRLNGKGNLDLHMSGEIFSHFPFAET